MGDSALDQIKLASQKLQGGEGGKGEKKKKGWAKIKALFKS